MGWMGEKDFNGSRTVRPRKLDGVVTEAGEDDHGEWSKTKDLLYFEKNFFSPKCAN